MNESVSTEFDPYLMLECMSESVLITTADLLSPGPYIIYVNPAFEKMTLWKKEEVLGKNPRLLQGPKTDYSIFSDLREKLDKGEIWSGRTFNYRKDGSEFYMQWSISPIRDLNGNIFQYIAVQKDVTKIVRTEQKLQKSREKEKKRMLQIQSTNLILNDLIKDQKRTLDLFVKYVPEPVVKKALKDTEMGQVKSGEQLEAALLFCDIRRFTSMAEELTPGEVVHFLNVYYSFMSDVIKHHNGVINQFVGDEIFVCFGAPVAINDPELSAVKCAMDMIKRLEEINHALQDTTGKPIEVGIGINYGPIIAGNLGSDDRLSYSITGDAVNTAKRIESLTEEMSNTILISQTIYDETSDFIQTKPWGEVQIKGKNKKVNVFQVLG